MFPMRSINSNELSFQTHLSSARSFVLFVSIEARGNLCSMKVSLIKALAANELRYVVNYEICILKRVYLALEHS